MNEAHGRGQPWRKTALAALAMVVCPPEPGALGLTSTVAEVADEAIAELPPGIRHALLAGLGALAGLRTLPLPGRQPAAVDCADVGRRFGHWWSDGDPLRRTVARGLRDLLVAVHYDQGAARERIGYDPDAWIAQVARDREARWSAEIRRHRDALRQPDPWLGVPLSRRPDTTTGGFITVEDVDETAGAYDVVIVGSGAGGAVVAAELAEAGRRVLVLEEGPHVPTEGFTTHALASFRVLYRDGGLSTMLGRPSVNYAEGRCVGGSTTVNGGMSFRTPDRVLDRWRREHAMPDLTTTALDPLFRRVEARLHTATQDPGSIGRDQQLLKMGAERLGWRVEDNLRAQVHCGGCNSCILGCPTGAKQSTLVSYLPRAIAFGAHVLGDCRVDRVLFTGKRAVGVRARAAQTGGARRLLDIHAPLVVVCAGAIQTPALLLRSGARSPSGRLGRGLTVHPGANVAALFDEPVDGWKGVHQAYQVREFVDEGVLMAAVNLPPALVARSLPLYGAALGEVMEGYDRILTAGVLVEDTGSGRVRAVGERAVASYRLSELDADRLVRAVALLCEALFAAGATEVFGPFAGVPPLRDAEDIGRLFAERIPRQCMAVSTVHLMGTARMGGDPVRHVCDPYGKVYDTEGLRVADASLLPSAIGVNPMETIMVLATRCAFDIATSREPSR